MIIFDVNKRIRDMTANNMLNKYVIPLSNGELYVFSYNSRIFFVMMHTQDKTKWQVKPTLLMLREYYYLVEKLPNVVIGGKFQTSFVFLKQ